MQSSSPTARERVVALLRMVPWAFAVIVYSVTIYAVGRMSVEQKAYQYGYAARPRNETFDLIDATAACTYWFSLKLADVPLDAYGDLDTHYISDLGTLLVKAWNTPLGEDSYALFNYVSSGEDLDAVSVGDYIDIVNQDCLYVESYRQKQTTHGGYVL